MAISASKVGIGVVGSGFGGYGLTPAFRRDPRCEVLAIAASTIESATSAAKKWNISRAGTWQELVAADDLDAIAIAVPPALQPEIASAAFAAGKAVFAEKPLACGPKEASAMVGWAEASGLANMIDFIFPELDTWREAKRMLDDGQLGQLTHVFLDWRMESYDIRNRIEGWKTASEQGGGVMSNFGSHSFYYLEWLLGPMASLSASLSSFGGRSGTGDTLAVASVNFESGVTGSMTLSSGALLGLGHRLEIHGEDGAIVLANPDADPVEGFCLLAGTRTSGRLDLRSEERHSERNSSEDSRVFSVARLAGRFLDWVCDGKRGAPSFRDGLRSQELLHAASVSSAKGGCQVATRPNC